MTAPYRFLPVLLVLGFAFPADARAEDKKVLPAAIRIALVESLMRDSPTGMAKPVVDAFGALVRAQTGLDTTVVPGSHALALGRKIVNDEVQFGIFQGVEFAWAQERFPDLKPLIIIVNTNPVRQGVLVVRADSKLTGFADLKGKPICVPQHSRLHCELFLKRGCGGSDPKEFCSRVQQPATAEEALDDLIDGAHDAVLLDLVSLESYRRRKPARYARLKMVQKSEAFPPSVIAYKPGKLDQRKLSQFQDGLLKAQDNALGRHLLMLWRMTSFEKVPDDLGKRLDDILKAYPAPKEAENP